MSGNMSYTVASGKLSYNPEDTVHVRGLKQRLTPDEVKQFFEDKIGKVAYRYVRNGVANIAFAEPAHAAKAIETLDGNTELGDAGEGIRVEQYWSPWEADPSEIGSKNLAVKGNTSYTMASEPPKYNSKNSVHVSGLEQSRARYEVKQFFEDKIGKVACCYVRNGIANIAFEEAADANKAVKELNGNTELGVAGEGIWVEPYRSPREANPSEIGSKNLDMSGNMSYTVASGKLSYNPEDTVHVRGLKQRLTPDEVKQFFEDKIGKVAYRYVRNGVANIAFAEPAHAAKAIETLDGNTELGDAGEGIRVEQYWSLWEADPRQNDEDSDEDDDVQFSLSTKKLDQWIKNNEVQASILRNSANGDDQNRGTCHRYSTYPTHPEKKFVDGDGNARKLNKKGSNMDAQGRVEMTSTSEGPSSQQPELGCQASGKEQPIPKIYWESHLECIMEAEKQPLSETKFVFTSKALKSIGSTHSESYNSGDRGSKLIIEKVGKNYFIRSTGTEAYKQLNAGGNFEVNREKLLQGSQFEKDHTDGKPKKEGENWFSVVSRKCSVQPNESQPFKCQVIVQSEIDAYDGEESDKELVEMKSTVKTIEGVLHHKSLIWWLQCEFANVDWLFLGEVSRENGRRELLSFEYLRNEVKINDQKRAEAAIFKFMIFVHEKFTKDETYVLERGSWGTTYKKGVAKDGDTRISPDMGDKIQEDASERNQLETAATGDMPDN